MILLAVSNVPFTLTPWPPSRKVSRLTASARMYFPSARVIRPRNIFASCASSAERSAVGCEIAAALKESGSWSWCGNSRQTQAPQARVEKQFLHSYTSRRFEFALLSGKNSLVGPALAQTGLAIERQMVRA